MLSIVGNSALSGNILLRGVLEQLAAKLPPGWRIGTATRTSIKKLTSSTRELDAVLTIRDPGKKSAEVAVEVKSRIEPKDVDYVVASLRPTVNLPVLVAAPFLSPRTQQRLEEAGFGYADLTGNVRLILATPGLFIDTTGATQNPEPIPRDRRSIRGPKAGRLVRALCDFKPPIGIRVLATKAGIDAGYASRIVDYLSREAFVTRTGRGPITGIDWVALLRRWSEEYSPFKRAGLDWYLAPRGIAQTVEQLKQTPTRYAVSGSWAAAQLAPVAPSRLLLCYADDPRAIVRNLKLRETDSGMNVALARPFDPVVYERTLKRKGVVIAAPSQVSVDLLGSPGRGPNEGEALIEWMRANEDAWRS